MKCFCKGLVALPIFLRGLPTCISLLRVKGITFDKNKLLRKIGFILAQVVIWILFCFIPIFFAPPLPEGMPHPAFESPLAFLSIFFIKNVKFIILFYVHYLILIPRYFNQKKYTTYVMSIVLLLSLVIAFPMLVDWLMPHRPIDFKHMIVHPHHDMHRHGKPKRLFGGENGIHFSCLF